jgi:hypothetical protein
MDRWQVLQAALGLLISGLPRPASSHLSLHAWKKRPANSPVEPRGAFAKRLGHAFFDGLAHAGYGEQIQRFLDGLPILRREENCTAALASDVDRLMGLCGLINEAVQIGSGFARGKLATPDRRFAPALSWRMSDAARTLCTWSATTSASRSGCGGCTSILIGYKVGGQKSFFECWLTAAELREVRRHAGRAARSRARTARTSSSSIRACGAICWAGRRSR